MPSQSVSPHSVSSSSQLIHTDGGGLSDTGLVEANGTSAASSATSCTTSSRAAPANATIDGSCTNSPPTSASATQGSPERKTSWLSRASSSVGVQTDASFSPHHPDPFKKDTSTTGALFPENDTASRAETETLHTRRDWYSTAVTFTAGGAAGAASRTCTAPLDRIKIIVQEGHLTSKGTGLRTKKHASLVDVAKLIYKDGGAKGFWRGNLVNCFKAGPEFAIVFSIRNYLTSLYEDCVERETQRRQRAQHRYMEKERRSELIRKREQTERDAMLGTPQDEGVHPDDDPARMGLRRAEIKAAIEREASILTPPFNRLGCVSNVPRLGVNCLIGAAAGVGAQSVLYPVELIKTRVVVAKSGEYQGGVIEVARTAYRQGGIREFYRGFTPNMVGIVLYRGLEMGIYSSVQQSIMLYRIKLTGCRKKDASLNTAEVGACGMFASVIAQTASYPLNVVRTKLQTQGSNGRKKKYTGMIDCFVKTYREKGVRALFSGLGANYLKAVPASGITFMVFEKVQQLLSNDD